MTPDLVICWFISIILRLNRLTRNGISVSRNKFYCSKIHISSRLLCFTATISLLSNYCRILFNIQLFGLISLRIKIIALATFTVCYERF